MHASQRPVLALIALLLALIVAACRQESPRPEPGTVADGTETDADPLRQRAEELARELLIVDTHVDVPYRLEEEWQDVSVRTAEGDFDYPRAIAGGLDAPFMSIYVPASFQETGGAREKADELIDMVEELAAANPSKFAIARSPAEVEAIFAEEGKIALPLGMENGAPVGDDLEGVRHFFDRGIRYVTLTHSKNNQICDSSYEDPDERRWNGLSPFGREVVAEMNRLGMLVDVSHVSDDAFYQVMEVSKAPAIASHSSCRHFTPGFERNMSDDMIRRLAEKGGVIQVNFGSAFLTAEANEYSRAKWDAFDEHVAVADLDRDSEEARAFLEEYAQDNPYPYADLSDVVAHVDRVVELVGVDHVGLGSDFDGVGDSLPTGLKDVSDYPNLIYELLAKGYTEDDVRKICSGNLMRVWREVERVAAELQSAG